MEEQSKTLRIMRRIGAPKPEKISISGILQSPDLGSLTLALPGGDGDTSAALLELLGSNEINIRFISKYSDSDGNTSMCICIDPELFESAVDMIYANEESLGIKEFVYRSNVRVLSVYPHKGKARVAERLFTTLRMNGIDPLSTNSASSVISCVLLSEHVEEALTCLDQAFERP